jgi:hypothetical protein
MKRTALQVRLHASEPSVVELTVGDCVQLDRLTTSPPGAIARRHGELLRPGTTQVALDAGSYMFRTLSDAHLRVVAGGVTASHRVAPLNKGSIPVGSPQSADAPPAQSPDGDPQSRGDEPAGEMPNFIVD